MQEMFMQKLDDWSRPSHGVALLHAVYIPRETALFTHDQYLRGIMVITRHCGSLRMSCLDLCSIHSGDTVFASVGGEKCGSALILMWHSDLRYLVLGSLDRRP